MVIYNQGKGRSKRGWWAKRRWFLWTVPHKRKGDL